jgi:hypothetical protein
MQGFHMKKCPLESPDVRSSDSEPHSSFLMPKESSAISNFYLGPAALRRELQFDEEQRTLGSLIEAAAV